MGARACGADPRGSPPARSTWDRGARQRVGSALADPDLGGEQASTSWSPSPNEERRNIRASVCFTWFSLCSSPRATSLALLIGTPIGFCSGSSKMFTKTLRSRSSRSCARSRRSRGCRWGSSCCHRGSASVAIDVAEWRALHHRDLRDVADRAQHRRRRARDAAGLPQRRQGAEALAAARRSCKS